MACSNNHRLAHLSANAASRAQFAARTFLLTATQIERDLGVSRETLAGWLAARRVFSIVQDGQTLFPAFQLDLSVGTPYPEIKSILDWLRMDYAGWSQAVWFVSPNDWLDGKAPLDVWPARRKEVAMAAQQEWKTFHAVPLGRA